MFLTNGLEVRMNGTCAGGTGAFIDQMATLLNVKLEDMDELAKIFPVQSCAFTQLYNSVFTIHPSFLHKSKKIHVA